MRINMIIEFCDDACFVSCLSRKLRLWGFLHVDGSQLFMVLVLKVKLRLG